MFHACTCSVGAALQRTRCSVWPDQRKYEKTMQVLCVCANTSWADTFWCIHMYTAGCTECAGTPCSPQSLKPLSWREGGEVGVAHCRPDLHISSPFVEICYIFVSIYGGDVFLSVRLPLFLLLLLLEVESQWLHEQCRLRTADKPAGCRVESPQADPDVCVWTLSRNVSIRRQFNIFF